jgi:hypothetical protein
MTCNTSEPYLYCFYRSVEILLKSSHPWKEVCTFQYVYGETKGDDDLISLNVTTRNLPKIDFKNAELNLNKANHEIFLIEQIEVYGDAYESVVPEWSASFANKKEIVSTENLIIIKAVDGRKICFECQFSHLQINVTLKDELIEKVLKKLLVLPDSESRLKHTIK